MALGLVGTLIATVCVLHRRGVIGSVWEPFPVVSASGWVMSPPTVAQPELDVVGFLLIAVTAALGGQNRWQTRPVLALATGASVAFTATSLLVRWTWQYFVLGTTSTLFFVNLMIAIAMLPLVADESYAAAIGAPTFERARAGHPDDNTLSEWTGYLAGAGGIVVGIILLLAPVTLLSHRAAQHAHLIGALVAAVGALSLAQVARSVRVLNIALGIGLVVAPLAFGYALRGALFSLCMGLLLMLFSTVLAQPEAYRVRTVHRVN